MSGQLARYCHPVVVDHLASNYVLGTLKGAVRQRTYNLSRLPEYRELSQRITYWENKLAPLNDEIAELPAQAKVWTNIEQHITPSSQTSSVQDEHQTDQNKANSSPWWRWFGFQPMHFLTAFSLFLVMLLSVNYLNEPESPGTLSYVAVMTDENETPQVVAATYGESQLLMLDILTLPDIDSEESYELWVTSKTDRQTRSLGVIPTGTNSFSRELTVAEWRLIKDSDSLLITVEELGGSSIGSPMGETISKGLCIRLSAWQET